MMTCFDEWRDKYKASPDSALTVAHIPARIGSTRILRKNVKELSGIPLIAYSILMARSIEEIDVVFVNTESPEIADLALSLGAEIPFMRPAELAESDTPMHAATQYFYDWLRGSPLPVAKVVSLYPTSPFRRRERIRQMVRDLDEYTFVHTAMPANVDWSRLVYSDEGELRPALNGGGNYAAYRPFYKLTGTLIGHSCVDEWDKETFQNVYLPENVVEAIDIDTPSDWELAENVLKGNKFDFGVDLHDMLYKSLPN